MSARYVDYSRYAPRAGAPAAAAPAPARGEARAAGPAPERPAREPEARPGALATFWLLYESRDQRLSLFETRDGHLAAVNPARLV
ncbi:hypothetical protein [Adlercreutzia faecimuris]|uniref:Uncharacterized protein n=1 Tax=Adlercreutzia faecimuris TaxID=2897341 RepID=A0ABS9WHH2_9ACTN|nr:hypothetical protein [Adlercreutzia sp. JBNU-10]MCI2241696.1 hypothetical protein [Adlercreutzia sp. JBNU-10]